MERDPRQKFGENGLKNNNSKNTFKNFVRGTLTNLGFFSLSIYLFI